MQWCEEASYCVLHRVCVCAGVGRTYIAITAITMEIHRILNRSHLHRPHTSLHLLAMLKSHDASFVIHCIQVPKFQCASNALKLLAQLSMAQLQWVPTCSNMFQHVPTRMSLSSLSDFLDTSSKPMGSPPSDDPLMALRLGQCSLTRERTGAD